MTTLKHITSTVRNNEGAFRALNQLGLIDKSSIRNFELLPYVDLISPLLERCNVNAPDARTRRRLNVLRRLKQQGLALSWGWPFRSFTFQKPAAGCLILYPSGWQSSRFLAIVSSRIGRDLTGHRDWFDALRTSVLAKNEELTLLSGVGTSTHQYVRRLAELVHADFVSIGINSKNRFKDALLNTTCSPHVVRPVVEVLALADKPNLDGLVIDSSEEVRVLNIRRGGNIAKAIEQRLDSKLEKSRILVRTNELESTDCFENELIQKGAIPWFLFKPVHESARPKLPGKTTKCDWIAPIASISDFDTSRFCSHFTRARYGPGPRETDNEFIDNLIFGMREGSTRSIGTLCQILVSRRIMSTNQVTRDETPVVCFTSVPLAEFPEKRVYRQHIGRWDFEPYGIAIDRQYLLDQGMRPVIYGDDKKWHSMTKTEQPFFQTALSANINWREEQELRVVGDVDLSKVGRDMAIVFVPDRHDARVAASVSRWPVVVITES